MKAARVSEKERLIRWAFPNDSEPASDQPTVGGYLGLRAEGRPSALEPSAEGI